jgi:hypothetical protein
MSHENQFRQIKEQFAAHREQMKRVHSVLAASVDEQFLVPAELVEQLEHREPEFTQTTILAPYAIRA